MEPYGVAFTDAVWCPHAPEESCFCRKPLPGMFDELRARHGLLPETTFMIGDKLDDLEFAVNAGLSAGLLVLSGKARNMPRRPDIPSPFRVSSRFRARPGVSSLRILSPLWRG